MGKYIHLFETIDELNEKYYGEDYHEPWVSLTLNGEEVSMTVTIDEGTLKYNGIYNYQTLELPSWINEATGIIYLAESSRLSAGDTVFDIVEFNAHNVISSVNERVKINRVNYNLTESDIRKLIPLTFDIISGGTVLWNGGRAIEYRKNGGEWTELENKSTISVVAGDSLQFRCNNPSGSYFAESPFSGTTAKFNAAGNAMSMYSSGGEFVTKDIVYDFYFAGFFKDCDTLISAEHLLLPATGAGGYGEYIFREMFENCVNLEKGPEIWLKRLTLYSCCDMFTNCVKLNYIKCLAEEVEVYMHEGGTIDSYATDRWMTDVSATGTFVKNEKAKICAPSGDVEGSVYTGWARGVNGIPEGWDIVDA